MTTINFNKIEKKWQDKWETNKIFEVKENKKQKYYVLDMFPYPSGEGLHMGHAFVYSLGDIYARFKRMQGFNVFYPIGFDSLGLPAENAAVKANTHPEDYTKKSIANFKKQQKAMGWSYDWSRLIKTSDPDYYKWDQWIFLKMLEKGIAYRKKASVNWCDKCKTVLANEQVINGNCWRHEDTEVEIKYLEQWFLKTTDYVEELLSGLENLDWPDRAKAMQRNWIGKSQGTEILFDVNGEKWPIFTTRPDTIYGVTFLVIAAQHPRLNELVTKEQKKEVNQFLKKIKSTSQKNLDELEKEGAFTGSYAINPITKEKIPIYTGNFAVADYGSGMIMAVPAHDQRDFEFAKRYSIPIKVVINPEGYDLNPKTLSRAYTGDGRLTNSDEMNNWNNKEAIDKITKQLIKKKLGNKTTQYKFKDWLISRQRYWGTPIPIIYCNNCGIIPVPENQLPIKLPKKVEFGKGNPLISNKKFTETKCPKCNKPAKRETDTMDTFANSSWYYLRYTDPKNNKNIFDPKKANYWAPINQYIGGPEHITMHLIYIRFYTKFLRDMGLLNFDEPALKYFTQGIVKGSDGEKMSKSRGNIVEPLEMIKKYGADSLRLYLVSNSSPSNDIDWDSKGLQGTLKLIDKIYNYFTKTSFTKSTPRTESKINKAIKEITNHVENFEHNLAIIKTRELFNSFEEKIDKKTAESFLKLLTPFCPHITEELWETIGNKSFISLESWPTHDESKIDEALEKQEQTINKTIEDISNILKIMKEKQNTEPKNIYLYVMPNELSIYNEQALSKRINKQTKIFAVNDKNKYDPENKSKKAKPGKPGIYLE
jgi:leucyl-tRNA synthetase